MSPVNLLQFYLRTWLNIDDSRLRRLDGIQGHRLAMAVPAVPVFSARHQRALSR
jgi:hypothetical protein